MPKQLVQDIARQARQIAEETFEQAKQQATAAPGQAMEQLGTKTTNPKAGQPQTSQPSGGDQKPLDIVSQTLKQIINEPGAIAGKALEQFGVPTQAGQTSKTQNVSGQPGQQEEAKKKALEAAQWKHLKRELDEEVKKYEQIRVQEDVQREKQEAEEKKKVEQIALVKEKEEPGEAVGKPKQGPFGARRVKSAQQQSQAERAGMRSSG